MLIAGNWKMNTDLEAATALARGVVEHVGDPGEVQVAVCPPFISLADVGRELDGSAVRLGAQNMSQEDEGAYTGEVAATMLTSVGCTFVILGHSERRQYFDESDELINQKLRKAMAHGLVPILCVGEKYHERELGQEEQVVRGQVLKGLEGVELSDADQLVLAYEPVWAIGTGKTASPEQAQAMHAFIRGLLTERFGEAVGGKVQLLYGGSMKPGNAAELLSQPDVDGGLIGGASLKPKDFAAIVQAGQEAG